MKRIISSLLAASICVAPLSIPNVVSPSWAQSRSSQNAELRKLIRQGLEYRRKKPKQAIEVLQKALVIARQDKREKLGAAILLAIGYNYSDIGQPQRALKFYNQALLIMREVGFRSGEATILNNIGTVYANTGQPQKALEFFNKALPIIREMGDRSGEASTLSNIGGVYDDIGQPQKALEFHNQALPITREVGDRIAEARTLNNIGAVYDDIGQPRKALEFHNQALPITREVGDRIAEARTLNDIGEVYYNIRQSQKALEFYKQALPIRKEVGDRRHEATITNNIAGVYYRIGQLQKALEFYKKVLQITREIDDRNGEARTLNNIGAVYYNIGQKKKALEFFKKALPIRRKVGDRSNEAITMSNIGMLYRNIGQPQKAIANYEQSIKIRLEIRSGLQRQNRQQFLDSNKGTAIALADLFIDQNQSDKAYEWINRVTTTELADYTRLVNAKVSNPEAQKALDNWNQKNQQLEVLRQELQENFSDELVRKMRVLEARVNKQAEKISRDFPEVAELFETTPTDIVKLKASIPTGTVVIHPILLTNVNHVRDSVAIFVLSKDKWTVVKTSVNPKELDQLIKDYRSQLEDRKNTDYLATSTKLYDILIRPVEKHIQKYSPKQISVITSGKLRYIPFETLRDSKTDKYLIEKYPINYLTRLSTRNQPDKEQRQNWWSKIIDSIFSFFSTILPFLNQQDTGTLTIANPQPTKVNLPGTEEEAKSIIKNIPNSEGYIGNQATLENFTNQAPRFKFIHLGTHGCFDLAGCENLGMKANTLLFANNEQYNIADAALLGLQKTELITLSACQTAREIDDNGQAIPGLAYVFERAGAKAIIAGIWNVPDDASKDIMIEFYANLKQGMSKSKALRQAKLSQIKRHPFFWSPFILIGDGS